MVARIADPWPALELHIAGVDGGAFILGGTRLTKIEDHGFLRDGSLDKGLPGRNWLGRVVDVTGRWPDALFANVIVVSGRVGAGEVYRWSGDTFRPLAAQLQPAWAYVGISPWSEGRTLALVRNFMAFQPRPMVRFTLLGGPPAPVPEFTPVQPPKGPRRAGALPCSLALDPIAFLALPTGHVFTAGHPCDEPTRWVVEQWAPGKTRGTVTELSSDDPIQPTVEDAPAFYARSPEDVYLLGGPAAVGPLLYHFDGSAWSRVKVPVTSALSALAGLPDGTIFVAARDAGQIWRRAPDGVWTAMDLPISTGEKRMSPTGVWAKSAAEVWVTAGPSVLRTGAPAGPAEVWEIKEDQPPDEKGDPKPSIRAATPLCKTVFALLYTLARTAPPDFDFPETRAALKGQIGLKDATFVETEDRGRRYFGAFVPSYAEGVSLVKTVRDKVAGSAPQLLCAEPKVRRTIKIDLRTGALMK